MDNILGGHALDSLVWIPKIHCYFHVKETVEHITKSQQRESILEWYSNSTRSNS